MNDSIIVGIDLGTTNSVITVWRNNNYEIIPTIDGKKSIPSIVGFTRANRYIGYDAKNMLELDPYNTIYEIKRLIGRKYSEETVKNDQYFLSYRVIETTDDNLAIPIYNRNVTPEEISSLILTELKKMAEDYLGTSISRVVITVPAYFNDSQRQATKDAATIASLDCVRIINEPTAAALAYGLQEKSIGDDINVIIYDLGGGTLDVSLLNINDGIFHVLASTGNTHLGGTDFDNRLMGYCIKQFKDSNKVEEINNCIGLQRLRKNVESAKKMLSFQNKVTIYVNNFYEGKDLNVCITKSEFECICQDLFIMALKPLEDVLSSANLSSSDVDDIILVGGATRMDAIRRNIKLFFKGKEPNSSVNPDNVVSIGAAIQGYILGNKDSPFSKNITLLDIIPLSLGIETIDSIMNVIVERNSIIPIKKERKFTTDTDFMTSVDIKVYEGERKLTTHNNLLGTFTLDGINEEYRGVPQINVTFDIDINGIINVTAEDLKTNNTKSITVKNNKNRLTIEEINKLIIESNKMSVVDGLERSRKILRYKINDLCFNIKFNLDATDTINLDKESIITFVDDLSKSINDKNIEELKQIKKTLKEKYGVLIYKKTVSALPDYSEFIKVGENVFNEDDNDDNNIDESPKINISYDEKQDIYEIRDNLLELCHNVLDIIGDNDIDGLRNLADDTIMWIYIKDRISKDEYIERGSHINSKLAEYIEQNYNHTGNKCLSNKIKDLEQLCYSVLSVITSNDYSVHDDIIVVIKDIIHKSLNYILEDEVIEDNIDEYIKLINSECDKLYEKLIK